MFLIFILYFTFSNIHFWCSCVNFDKCTELFNHHKRGTEQFHHPPTNSSHCPFVLKPLPNHGNPLIFPQSL